MHRQADGSVENGSATDGGAGDASGKDRGTAHGNADGAHTAAE